MAWFEREGREGFEKDAMERRDDRQQSAATRRHNVVTAVLTLTRSCGPALWGLP